MADDVVIAARGLGKKFARSLKRSFVYGARDLGRALLGRRDDEGAQMSVRRMPPSTWCTVPLSAEA